MRLGAVRARIAAEMLDPVALVRFDADLGVEVEAVDASLATCRQEHEAEVGLGGVARSMGLGAAGAGGGGEGLREDELVVVERRAIALGEQGVSAPDDAREDRLDLGGAGGRCGEEAALSARVHAVGAVRSERVETEMGPQVRRRAERRRHDPTTARTDPPGTAGRGHAIFRRRITTLAFSTGPIA